MFKVTMFVALALVVAACTPGGEDKTTSSAVSSSTTTLPSVTTTAPRPDGFGGQAIVGIPFGLATLNPFQAGGVDEMRFVGNALWATVYDIDPDTWERLPDNVSALPSTVDGAIEINDDGSMTVQYQVPRTATWSDGRPVSGADLAFTAEAMRDLAFKGNGAVDPIMKTVVGTDSVEQVAWITFSEPNLAFEDALWIVLPSHALEGVDLEHGTDGSDWPSGGPFIVESFEPGGSITLVRNPNYWKTDASGRQLPYIDTVVFTPVGVEDVAAFIAGDVDTALVDSSPETLSVVEGESANGAQLLKVATPVLEHLTFNFLAGRDAANPASLNGSTTFRQAVPLSLDPATFDREETAWTGTWPGVLTPTDGSAWSVYSFDPVTAESTIASLEDPDPSSVLTTTGNANLRTEVGDGIAESFAAMGVDMETEYIDSLEFFGEVLGTGIYDIGMWAWVNDGGYAGVIALMEGLDPASDTNGFNGWGNGSSASDASARFSELVIAAGRTGDPLEFAAIIAEAEAILAGELPLLPLFHRAGYAAVWAGQISNVEHNGSSSGLTWNIEAWQRVGE